ncbi:MAG: PAS domain-containing protein, partial [Betaproteobacteria bacterium]
MRHQPTQSARPEQPARDSITAPKGTKHTAALASVAFLGLPFQGDGIAALPSETGTVFTAILAVLVTVLGISASVLYRHMHHREEESRRRAENAEAELRALLMITDDAVLLLSSDGNVRAANPAAEELFGRDADNFIGEPLTDLITQPLALAELTKNGPVNFATWAKRGGIDSAPVEMLLSPVELSGGKAFLSIIQEPREAAAAEPAKEPTGTTKFRDAVGKFTHDLNNQLTSLLGNLSLTLMARPGDPATNERVLNAKKTAVRAQVLNQELQSLLNSSAEPKPAKPAQPTTDEMTCTILPMPANPPATTRM